MAKLNELFRVIYGNKFDLNKMTLQRRSEGGVGFVGRAEQNHGVSATVAPIPGVAPFPAGLISVALGGTRLLCSFIQEHPFYTAQNVAVLDPFLPMSHGQKLYFCLCIRKNRFRYGAFGREANRTLRTLQVPDLVGIPPWTADSAGKGPVVSELGKLLDEMAALSEARPASGTGSDSGEKLVPLCDLFDVVYGSNLELNRLVLCRDGVNFVSRSARNNGVSAKVEPIPGLTPIPGGVLTVAGGGSVLETFFQANPFYSGRDLYYLRPIEVMSPEEMLFYAHCVRQNRYRYSYGRQANRTLKAILVPSRGRIPAWVYGGCERVVKDLRQRGLTVFEPSSNA